MAIAEIHVTLKPSLLDVQGTTVRKALHQLGYEGVRDVRIGKFITVEVDGSQSGPQLQAALEEMCQKLLANPVIEDFEIALDAQSSAEISRTPAAQILVAPLVESNQVAGPAVVPHASAAAASGMAAIPSTGMAASVGTPLNATAITAPATVGAPIGMGAAASVPATAASVTSVTATPAPASHSPVQIDPAELSPTNAPLSQSPAAAGISVAGLSPAEQMEHTVVSSSEAVTPDPFSLDFARFDAMSPADKLAMQELAWRKHGTWIKQQIDGNRAQWILCLGQHVVNFGDSLDSFPSDDARARAGRESGLVPWVFVRPPAS
jgi:phosphoribosylformylglycinamidine synthase PurS subunit